MDGKHENNRTQRGEIIMQPMTSPIIGDVRKYDNSRWGPENKLKLFIWTEFCTVHHGAHIGWCDICEIEEEVV